MNSTIVLPALRSTKASDKSALKTHQQWRVQYMRETKPGKWCNT